MRRTTSFALALSLVLGTALVAAAPTGAKETEARRMHAGLLEARAPLRQLDGAV